MSMVATINKKTEIIPKKEMTPEEKSFHYLTAVFKTYLPQARLSEKILSIDPGEQEEAEKDTKGIEMLIDGELKKTERYCSFRDIIGCSLWEVIRKNNQAQIQCLVMILEEIDEHKRQRFEEEKNDFIIGCPEMECPETGEPVNPASVIIEALEKIEEAANLAEKLGINPNTFIPKAIGIFEKNNPQLWGNSKEKREK